MRHAISIIIALLVLSGCAGNWQREVSGAMKTVDVGGAIDRSKAERIAVAYFESTIGYGCGAPGEPRSEGQRWVVPVYFGYAAVPVDLITSDKHTGAVSRRAIGAAGTQPES